MPDPRAASEADFGFEVGPYAPSDLGVVRFKGLEGISELFSFDLTLASRDPAIELEACVGEDGLLTWESPDGDRWVHGIVSVFEQIGHSAHFTYYRARLVPRIWLLGLRTGCRIFQNMSIPDIIAKVLEEGQIPSDQFKFSLKRKYKPRDYVVQYRESELDFICRLMEEEGIFYFFEHSEDGHVLIMADDPAANVSIDGEPAVVYRDPGFGDPDQEHVYAFRYLRQIRTGSTTRRDFEFKKPTLDLEAAAEWEDDVILENYDYPGGYKELSVGKDYAKLRLEELRTDHEVGSGEGNCLRFVPGAKFSLTEHPRDDFNLEFLLTRIQHWGSQPQVLQEDAPAASEEPRYRNSFQSIPAATVFRPPRITPRPVIEGPQTAMVVGPSGEEIYPDEYGRVKVQFHWDREGTRDENSSCWIRVSQQWAGTGWGFMYLPRIGQEVIVHHLEGDPDQPIITGRVYNGDNPVPYPLPDEKTKSTIKSDSSMGGGGSNEIRFEDLKGSEEIYVHAQKDQNEVVENNHSTSVTAARTITVGGTHTETITGDTTIKITEGNLSHDVVAGTGTFHVKGAVKETYDDKQETTVAKDIIIKSNETKIHMTAATEIKLEVGQSKLLMKSDGSIELKGVNLAIDGSASVNIHGASVTSKADADNSTKGTIVLSEGSATNTIKGGMVMLNP
jgi:type VI secretion system secreted protein VgrG